MNQCNGFLGLSILFFSGRSPFPVVLEQTKKKAWKAVFQRLIKTNLLFFEGLMKNHIFFSNGMLKLRLDMVTRGRYTGIHSIKELPKKVTLAPLQTGV